MEINDLEKISVIGLGLLGGSLGLAVQSTFPRARRLGYSHRAVTRTKAIELGGVDEIYPDVADAVRDAQLVILASPISTFEPLMQAMADHLAPGCIVTDVGSTKVLPVRWARRYLKKTIQFLGSHPMAGSEQRGVEFARADLFFGAPCILTPTQQTKKSTIRFLKDFWQALGMRVQVMNPSEHDRVLARISHLPHLLATAMVNVSDPKELLLCGKGFLDTTRIASGPPNVWRDIIMANTNNTRAAIGKLIRELTRMQTALDQENEKTIVKMLTDAQAKRNTLVEQKMKRKELPT
jgi:prephenate dehydrogenase